MYVKAKMRPVETTPGIAGGGKDKGQHGRNEFEYDILDT
jgi:hypothetical protein